jgi:hypothetical protein
VSYLNHYRNTTMIQQTRSQGSFTAVLRLESILKSMHLWRTQSDPMHDGTESAAKSPETDHGVELAALLDSLGVGQSTRTATRLAHDSAASARAAAAIADWLSYLPRDCVRAMVVDGWHWSS